LYVLSGLPEKRLLALIMLKMSDKRIVDAVKRMLQGEMVKFEGEYHHALTSSKVTPIRELFAPIVSEEGEVVGGIAVLEDITERISTEKKLQDAHKRLEEIIDFLPDATLVISREGRVIAWNRAMEKMTLIPKAQIMGRGNYEYALPFYNKRRPVLLDLLLMPAGEFARHIENYEIIQWSGDTLHAEVYVPNIYGGRGAYLLASASRLRNVSGEIFGAIETLRDITERKESEKKIKDNALELERLYHQLNEAVEKAREFHERILPKTLPTAKGISIAAHYQTAQKLGGDFYDVVQVGNKLIIYLSDVSGHGMDGAMLNVFVKNTINGYLAFSPDKNFSLKKILQFLSEQYNKENYPNDCFISIFISVLDLETFELSYSGAGFQNTPLVYQITGNKKSILQVRGLPITSAVSANLFEFEESRISLTPGSTILFSTDGLTEQTVNDVMYADRLKRIFYENSRLPPDIIVQAVNKDFQRFNNGCLQGDDDITILVLQVDPINKKEYRFKLESRFAEIERFLNEYLCS